MSFLRDLNWVDIIQSTGILFGLYFSIASLRRDTKERKLQNYLTITQYHREVWSLTFENPEVRRVFIRNHDAILEPLSDNERQFLTLIFTHISCSFEMERLGSIVKIERLREDIKSLLEFPLVCAFWDNVKEFHNSRFVEYIESCRP